MLIKREDFEAWGKTIFGRAKFQPPFKASEPFEDEARLVHAVKGHSKINFPNGSLELRTGDSILMKCDNFLNTWFENEDGEPSQVIVVKLFPDVLKNIYGGNMPEVFSQKDYPKANPVEKIPASPIMDNYVQSLKYYMDEGMIEVEEFTKIKIQELVVVLGQLDTTNKLKYMLSNLFRPDEHKFNDIINANLYEDLSIEELAFLAGLSLSSFKRKFSSFFGASPAQYIKTKRLEKAQLLLETSDMRVAEIAYEIGYNDPAYFTKTFTDAYNATPTEYRKSRVN